MNSDEIRQQIELQIVEMIKRNMETGALTEERAQAISQHVLNTLSPGMEYDELIKAIPKLDDSFPELSPVILPFLQDYEKNANSRILQSMRQLIKQGQYDAAAKLGKDSISQIDQVVFEGKGKSDDYNKPDL